MSSPKLTVFHINDARGWRGGERQTLLLARGLHALGHRSVLCAPAAGTLFAEAVRAGIETIDVPLRAEFDLFSVVKLRKAVRATRPHVVHTHTGHAHTTGLLATCGMRGTKLVVSRRVDFHMRKNAFSRLKYRSSRVDKILAISNAVRDILLSDGVPAEKIGLAYSGIDLEKFSAEPRDNGARDELGMPSDAIVAGCVAALVDHKAHDVLIRAAQSACARVPGLHMLLVGKGPLEPMLRSLVSELGLETRVHFAGYRTDIGRLMRSMDMFVLASRTEGLGTAVLDAMTVGLPVVATRAGGIPEMVEDGKNGLLCPVDDHAALADNLVLAAGDSALRRELGEGAREAVKRFSIENTVKDTLAVYHELLGH